MDPHLIATIGRALLDVLMSNYGGFAALLVWVSWLAWKLRDCERKHDLIQRQNAKLAASYLQMSGAVNTLAGARIVEVASLEDVLGGKDAVRYLSKPDNGRRAGEKQADAVGGNQDAAH